MMFVVSDLVCAVAQPVRLPVQLEIDIDWEKCDHQLNFAVCNGYNGQTTPTENNEFHNKKWKDRRRS
jgi:hypothetical protein